MNSSPSVGEKNDKNFCAFSKPILNLDFWSWHDDES